MAFEYQYETSPRKMQPKYEPTKKKTSGRPKAKKRPANKKVSTKKKSKYNYKPVAYIVLTFAMLFTISYRYSLINEQYNEKETIKSKVSDVQKQNEQLKVNIENSLNLNSVEKAAQEKLGMQKLDNTQKIYLNLQKKDYVEPASEEVILNDNVSWFDRFLEKLTQIIK